MQQAYTHNDLTVQWGVVMAALTELLVDLAYQIRDDSDVEHADLDADLAAAALAVVAAHVEHRAPTVEEARAAMAALTAYRLVVGDDTMPDVGPDDHIDGIPGDAAPITPDVSPGPGDVLPAPPHEVEGPDIDIEGD
jgi:hypothetical protein